MDEAIDLVFRGISWISILLTFGIAVAALARLKLTPSGALLGVGFLGLAAKNAATSLYYSFVFRPAVDGDGGYSDVELVFESYRWVTMLGNVAGMFLWVFIGVGAALLPFSLKSLRDKS